MTMTKSLPVPVPEVPFRLLPQAVAELIRRKGEAVYRISVVRTHYHHYNVSVRTKRIKRELAPETVAVFSAVPGNGKEAEKAGRGCAA
jgi:hypothetical protein